LLTFCIFDEIDKTSEEKAAHMTMKD